MARTPRVKVTMSLQGPMLARVRAIRDCFAFQDEAETLRFLIRLGINHTTPQLASAQVVAKFGPAMEEQFALAIKDMTRGQPHDPPTH